MPRYASFGRLDSQLIDDGDTAFASLNQRLRPDQLKAGEVAVSQNGRMDVDGSWQTRKGYRNVFAAIANGAGALVLPFHIGTINAGSFFIGQVYEILTIGVGTNWVDLGASSATVGVTFTATGVGSGTGTATARPAVNDLAVVSIYGTCLYSDQSAANTEYIVLVTATRAILVKTSNTAVSYSITYPATQTVDASCEVIQAFNYLFVFRDGKVAFQWDGSSLTGSPVFTLVDNGNYTQPLVYDTAGNTAIVNGVVTVTESGHNILVGDSVIVSDAGTTNLNPLTEYRVYAKTSTTFLFKADASDITGARITVGKRQSIGLGFTHMPAPPWATYHQRRLWMPFNYSMAGTSGTPTIVSRNVSDELIASDILDQNTYDQIDNQFKIASGSSDFIVGLHPFSEDALVVFARNSIHLIRGVGGDLQNSSVQEVTREVGAVARKSIIQIGNQILFLSDNGVYSVNFEDLYNLRGASVPMSEPINPIMARINKNYAANAIGVYHDNRYYLAVPLDASTVNNAVIVFNLLNNGWESLDVINSSQWNIIGFVRSGAGTVNRLHTVSKEGGIHVIDEAGVNANDYFDNLCLSLSSGGTITQLDIDSVLTTRQYTYSTLDRKRFNSYELHIESAANIQSDADLSVEVENPDSSVVLGSVLSVFGKAVPSSEDASIRSRIGNKRGYGAQFTVAPSQGRPKIRAVKITGAVQNGSTSSTE